LKENILIREDHLLQSRFCYKMEGKFKVIIGFFVCASVIAIALGLAFGVDWTVSPGPKKPTVTSEPFNSFKSY
jgi:hypothetical protein